MSYRHIYPDFALPEELLTDENFLMDLKSKFSHMAATDDGTMKDTRRLIEAYNDASEDSREAMNEVFVWATGYSFPSLAARVVLQEEPADRQDEESVHDLMLDWEKKAPKTRKP